MRTIHVRELSPTLFEEYLAEFLADAKRRQSPVLEAVKLEARLNEQRTWVLPTVNDSHTHEQSGEGSGIMYFDNERLGRCMELEALLHPKAEEAKS